MIRVTTLYASTAASTARYYTKYLTDAPGELPGQWAGHQAGLLGLSGTVSTEALERVLSGHDPNTGDVLGMALVDRTMANGKTIRAVAGFDATVSAPKSVSVLWGLTGDSGFAEAHDVAVRAVLSHLERYGSTTRVRSNGGRLHPDSQGLTVAGFRQTTSRADDPQLHTHLVISAKVQTDDGRWLALDARMLKRYQRTLGGLYQSVLRAELTDRFGVAFGEIVKGQAEIAGVPTELLELFSKRTAQVDDALTIKLAEFYEREGRDPTPWEKAALTREAAADTRVHKTDRPVDQLRPEWIDAAFDAGITPDDLTVWVTDAARDRPPVTTVSPAEMIDVLSAGGSAWHREDVVRVFCDLQRPVPGIAGAEWARAIEDTVDRFIAVCVDLDPARDVNRDVTRDVNGDANGDPRGRVSGGVCSRVRGSDGRSEWIEPVAAHITSEQIIAEEEAILAWAIDAHLTDPRPSTTVQHGSMDVLQYAAASAVAGDDRLVLVVGPAGTGKTTMLRAAVDDLHAKGRNVYGVSTTAKAARTLERETGMRADTIAKLVHEWNQPDRPPDPEWQLPPGTTLIVDEAGMIGTPHLHRLTQLADQHHWRLALVGDPHQLQAVGLGGMFTELCATGRTIELEHVHRFIEPWEAEASLLLRHGNPKALDLYQEHDRIRAGTLAEHLDYFARTWITNHHRGETTAVMASTNQHVDAINQRVQAVRQHSGHIHNVHPVPIGGGESADIGDIVATRRNHRHLTTTIGERVRNRDLWTVTATHDNGDLTLEPVTGHGQITLPADYVTQHVRLGYAATEMGTQSDTVTTSLELASAATTCRNLYVAMTRGQRDNIVCVITDTHDVADARDILDTIINIDRADTPATTQRRNLHAQDRQPQQRQPQPPRLQPRCQIPDWFEPLRQTTIEQLDVVISRHEEHHQRTVALEQTVEDTEHRYRQARHAAEPFEQAVTRAEQAWTAARDCRDDLADELGTARRRDRPILRAALAIAEHDLTRTDTQRTTTHAAATGPRRTVNQIASEIRDLHDQQRNNQLLQQLALEPETIDHLTNQLHALHTWHQCAQGHPITATQLECAADHLHAGRQHTEQFRALRDVLPVQSRIEHHIERRFGPELSID